MAIYYAPQKGNMVPEPQSLEGEAQHNHFRKHPPWEHLRAPDAALLPAEPSGWQSKLTSYSTPRGSLWASHRTGEKLLTQILESFCPQGPEQYCLCLKAASFLGKTALATLTFSSLSTDVSLEPDGEPERISPPTSISLLSHPGHSFTASEPDAQFLDFYGTV